MPKGYIQKQRSQVNAKTIKLNLIKKKEKKNQINRHYART
jgi:hypothetical protein